MAINFEQIIEHFKSMCRTGFQPHPDRTKYHGFTCPNCGRHEFGTNPLPGGVEIGVCHGNQYAGNQCDFTWNRNNEQDENNCFHNMTREQWMETFNKSLP